MISLAQRCVLTAAIACTLSACSSIERSQEIQGHRLAAKVSSKTEVVNAIGLPRAIEKDEARGVEIWLYTGKPVSTSFFVPLPFAATPAGSGMTMVHYLDVGSKSIPSNEPVVLALVFDKAGQLIEVQDKKK